ncbi:MAG TPA: glycosyltransferase family 39 protein [Opitutus sp.]|nr:glycosyltransferase family 39 protein [Opitutus sp.]
MSRPPFLPRAPADNRRLLLAALCGGLAVFIGFVSVPVAMAEELVEAGGYYYMAGLFCLFLWLGWRAARPRRDVWLAWLRRPGWTGVALAVATIFVLWSDPFRHKVLFDEYVLQATAWHMHATKEIGTVIRAYDLFGTWQPIDTFLDKRPYFFAFLLSLVHDLTGYRLANVFFLNGALAAAFLGLAYWFGRQLTNRAGGLLAVALLATMPLLGQNATSAGMEIHNLTMLAFTMVAALLYLRAPDGDRLGLLCVSTVLLAQSRYESAAFVLATAVVVLAGWRRAGRVILPWPAIVTPLLLVPYAWQNRVLSATPLLWQLQEGQKSRFALSYLTGNLEGAWDFFFNFGPNLANSWWLSALAAGALLWLGAGVLLRRRVGWFSLRVEQAPLVVGLAYGLVVAGNLAMLMFYYWSRLDDTIASRFALPSYFILALVVALVLAQLDRRWPATRLAFLGTGAFLFISALPAIAHRLYTDENLVMQEVQWEHDVIESTGAERVLVISNKSTIPWVLWKIPALVTGVARDRGEQIRWHMRHHTFDEVIVTQALRPTTADGNFGVDPDDVLPKNFRLETIAVKRFGGRMARLSRLMAVEPPPRKAASVTPPPPAS